MKTPKPKGARPEVQARRAAATIVDELAKPAADTDVFKAFEELDALPPEVVREVLTAWTGPAPDPELLDAATRRAHGFPPAALVLRVTQAVTPKTALDLSRIAQEQLRTAGTTWDGLDLPAEARLAEDGGESSFAGTLEHRTLSTVDGTPAFDVLLFGDGNGTIFRAATTELAGAIAYGTVEMTDRVARVAVQEALSSVEIEDIEEAVWKPKREGSRREAEGGRAKPRAKKTVAKKKTASTKTAAKKKTVAKKKTAKTTTARRPPGRRAADDADS